jgi:hypothetical protein
MAANFTEFGEEGSANSCAVALHHAVVARRIAVRRRAAVLRAM